MCHCFVVSVCLLVPGIFEKMINRGLNDKKGLMVGSGVLGVLGFWILGSGVWGSGDLGFWEF